MEVGNLITEDYAGKQSINFVISELVNNIYDHTPFEKKYASHGYIYAQLYPIWKKLDITVYDDGLSIPGRFDKSNVDYENDCHAIEKALTQFTTIKNRQSERGNGLGSCMKLIKANKGSALIVSRKGCLEVDEKRKKYHYHNLNNEKLFKGTLITLRFRDNPINFYEALDDGYIHGTPYKYVENNI